MGEGTHSMHVTASPSRLHLSAAAAPSHPCAAVTSGVVLVGKPSEWRPILPTNRALQPCTDGCSWCARTQCVIASTPAVPLLHKHAFPPAPALHQPHCRHSPKRHLLWRHRQGHGAVGVPCGGPRPADNQVPPVCHACHRRQAPPAGRGPDLHRGAGARQGRWHAWKPIQCHCVPAR